MPRLPRYAPSELPSHIIQRGNNRQPCFADDQDRAVYHACLEEASRRYCVDVHAMVLMTNHAHLLVTPRGSGSVSAMMQALGRDYVSWFNKRHTRTGTLWEGRFRSFVIESETYLLRCYRYIELNPVRAGIVTEPGQYSWSSYRQNAWGYASSVIVQHPVYLALGKSPDERRAQYRALFDEILSSDQLREIRDSVNSGNPLGSKRFKDACKLPSHQHKAPAGLTDAPGSDPDTNPGSDPLNKSAGL